MKVIRTQPPEGWTPIANAALQDRRISWRAKGLLAELLSYPDDWKTSIDKLVGYAKRGGGKSEGRDAMLRAVAELESAGYVAYQRVADERGRWATILTVTDDPKALVELQNRRSNRHPEKPNVGKPEGRSSGVSVDRQSENQGVNRKTTNKTKEQEASSLRPRAKRGGAQAQQRQPAHLKTILDNTDATPADAEAFAATLGADPKIKNLGAYIRHLADEGDLQRRLDQWRTTRREQHQGERDTFRQILRKAVLDQPECSYGFRGGHLTLDDGWMPCSYRNDPHAKTDRRDLRDVPAALANYLRALEERGHEVEADRIRATLTDEQLDVLVEVEDRVAG